MTALLTKPVVQETEEISYDLENCIEEVITHTLAFYMEKDD